MKKFGLVLLLVLFLTTACGAPEPAQPTIIVNIETPPASDGYPAPEADTSGYPAAGDSGYPVSEGGDPGYPAPEISTPAIPDQGEPDPNLGVVAGRLLYNGKPVGGVLLYLSDVIQNSEGVDGAVAFNRQTSIRTITDAEGAFRFINIEPGRYGLVMDTISEAFLLHFPGGDPILPEIQGNETVSLGDLDYDTLPIPEP